MTGRKVTGSSGQRFWPYSGGGPPLGDVSGPGAGVGPQFLCHMFPPCTLFALHVAFRRHCGLPSVSVCGISSLYDVVTIYHFAGRKQTCCIQTADESRRVAPRRRQTAFCYIRFWPGEWGGPPCWNRVSIVAGGAGHGLGGPSGKNYRLGSWTRPGRPGMTDRLG